MIPVSGRKDDAVIKKLINSIGEFIFSYSRVGHLMEVLGEGEKGMRKGGRKWKIESEKKGGREGGKEKRRREGERRRERGLMEDRE